MTPPASTGGLRIAVLTVLDIPGAAARLSITPRESGPESRDRPGLVGASRAAVDAGHLGHTA